MTTQHILIVDDSMDMLELQHMILESAGYSVTTARSGSEAFWRLSEMPYPDLVILDMQMEDMSGADLMLWLEEKRPDIIEKVPFVLLSGSENLPLGKAVGYIKKFPDIPVYLELVQCYLRKEVGDVTPCYPTRMPDIRAPSLSERR